MNIYISIACSNWWDAAWAVPVADNYGVKTYAKALFLLTIWWAWNWGDASACPYTHVEDWVEGKTELRVVGLKIFAEILGGVAIFKSVSKVYKELSTIHSFSLIVNSTYFTCTAMRSTHAYFKFPSVKGKVRIRGSLLYQCNKSNSL